MPTASPAPAGRRFRRAALLAVVLGAVSSALAAYGADVVIMSDGFVIQGRFFKETETTFDPVAGPVRINKANGLDAIQDGPRLVFFSTHAVKGGKLEKEVPRPEYPVYTTKVRRGRDPLKPYVKVTFTPFGPDWRRVMRIDIPPTPEHPTPGFENIHQQVASLDPYWMAIVSDTHAWIGGYFTAEEDPKDILKLLSTHPDLKDPPGKIDPFRRLAIASFFKDVSAQVGLRRTTDDWLTIARSEMERLKKDYPMPWDKEVTERYEKLRDEIDLVETRIVLDNVEAAVSSGRYEAARAFLAGFSPKRTDAKESARLGELKARIEDVQPRYELTARLLRDLIEGEGGLRAAEAFAAAAGSPGLMYGPRPKLAPETATLLTAAGAVLNELHADTAPRLELFRTFAEQADQRRKAGKDPGEKPAELLALAVTGWLKGKNGADKNVPAALRCWATREMALAYLRTDIGNNRKALLDGYLQTGKPLAADEMAQLITLLPPPFPEDLTKPAGKPIPADREKGIPEGLSLREAPPLPGAANGYKYVLKLPPEYHHGRAYPVILALTTPAYPAEQLVGFLAPFADRHGYIVAAPEWANQFGPQAYDYSGNDHPAVTATLRDVLRRFQVDPDKVFLYGVAEGANFALDVGLAHPDLFAGVVANGPNPPTNIFLQYWHNAQKLPVYVVTGELSGAFPNLRKLYEKWTVKGFPALLTMYKGRQTELYPLELPRIFDWMGRKSRVRGAASLRLNQPGFEPWQVLRDTDDRFYWVGVAPGGLGGNNNRVANWQARAVTPAQFKADIGRNGEINITSAIGVKKFEIWLERDLIDWSRPIKVNVNNHPAREYKAKVLEPDLHLMFEELYRTGDRKMLYLGKLEIKGDG